MVRSSLAVPGGTAGGRLPRLDAVGGAGSITIAGGSTAEGQTKMTGFLLRAAISALGLWVASQLLGGLQYTSTGKLLLAAVLLGLVNAIVRPVAFILTLPLTVVTLGLFLFVLNAGMVALVAWLVPGFSISGFWTAVGTAVIVGLVSWAASSVIGSNGRFERFTTRRDR
jgi:putative membrane protein